jgi:RNA polymerase sigma factor (sigma-70 family)
MDAGRLFAEHHAALFRYLARMTGDPDAAADAAQEAFVRLVEKPPAPGQTRAWLFRVGINAARLSERTRHRRLRLVSSAPERQPVGDGPEAPDRAAERSQERERVQRALAGLSERDRTILLMREEGFTHREIAEAVGTTTPSVGTLVARALGKLAAELGLDDEEDE